MTRRLLTDTLTTAGVDPEAVASSLDRYVELLQTHGRSSNLIGPLTVDAIFSDLLLDALLPGLALGPDFVPDGPVIDMGSGAGIPGIPLALLWPQAQVHLVEPRRKRATFLGLALRSLSLAHVKEHQCRIDVFKGVPRHGAAVVAAKAFQPPATYLKTASEWLAPGGLVLLYLSQTSWTEEIAKAAEAMGYSEVARLAHPGRETRFGMVMRLGS